MGFVSMRRNFGRHMRTLLYVIFGVFLVSCFYYFGSYTGSPARRQQGGEAGDVVAVVNGEKVDRATFETVFQTQYERYEQMGMGTLGMLEMLRWQLLDSLIQQRLLVAAAKEQGIKVSRGELNKELDRQIEEALEARGARAARSQRDRRLVEDAIRSRKDEVRDAMLVQRLQEMVKSQVKATDQAVRESYKQVKARHILVRVDESGKNGLPDAEAKQKADGILAKLKDGADFADQAKQSSDDQANADKGGDLDYFGRGQMTPEFEKAAFALKPGGMSDVVKTPFGYHIIKVEDERYNLPDDYQDKKGEYRKQYIERQLSRAWQEFTAELRRQATIEIKDPEMRAAKARMEGRTDEAIEQFTQALRSARPGDQVRAAILFTLGQLYGEKENWEKAAEMFEGSLDAAMSSLQEIYLALGEAYAKLGNKEKSLEYYQAAEDEAPDDFMTRQRLLTAYEEMGDVEAAARQKTWIDEQQRQWAEEQQKRIEEAAKQAAPEAQEQPEPATDRDKGQASPDREKAGTTADQGR
ncbi:MAG: peptidylprolyl isomerase [Armatimonadota bacterium]|nr:MAG: peptidylprolyl isomerase [Armatimonadota bacterium]